MESLLVLFSFDLPQSETGMQSREPCAVLNWHSVMFCFQSFYCYYRALSSLFVCYTFYPPEIASFSLEGI